MSNSDEKAGFPDYSGYAGEPSDEHQASGQSPSSLNDQNYALHIDPRLNDQSEYSQVGGKRNSNEPYPGTGQQQNPNYPQEQQLGQGQSPYGDPAGYPAQDGQNTYDQQYAQQQPGQYPQPAPYQGGAQNTGYPQSDYQQTDFDQQGADYGQHNMGQQTPAAGQYDAQTGGAPDSFGYPAGDANSAYYGQQQQQQGVDPAYGNTAASYQNQGQGYEQSYAYPSAGATGEVYDNFSDQQFQAGADQDDTSFLGNDYPDEDFQQPEARKSNMALRLAVLFGVVVVGGGIAYAFTEGMIPLGGGDTQTASGSPEYIKRDATPIKERASEPGGKTIGGVGASKIYDRLPGKKVAGVTGGSSDGERLKSREEAPVFDTSSILRNGEGTTKRIETKESKTRGGSDVRMVKTLEVRPNGQIKGGGVPGMSVSGLDDSNYGRRGGDVGIVSSALRNGGGAARNNGGASQFPERNIGQGQAPIRRKVQEAPVVKRERLAPPPTQERTRVASIPEVKRDQPPVTRSTSQEQDTPPLRKPDLAQGEYVIQVVARRNEGDALAAFVDIQQRYPDILQPYQPFVQQADLTSQGKGVWYRLRIGPMNSKSEAAGICDQLASRGHTGCNVHRK